ncbi:MAG: polyphosphate polymerase domain-containing protein [Deltaproteobacteria bacterium]|nr:polyphosphate polymerase domain-containing protein [Deltaproteobacteria bacterium]
MIRRFNRYELKYILPVEKCDRIIRDLQGFAHPDSHGGARGYHVVSLYYDSPALDFFWAKIEGIKYRRKVRLRIYPENDIEATTRGMVEIKQRINRTVQKRRIELPLDEAEQLCTGYVQLTDLDLLDQQVASEVQYLVNAMHLQPTGITDYWRRAFVGDLYDAGLRITFDTELRFRAHALTVNLSAENHLFLPPDICIMEVKANDAIPNWVTSLLGRHNCQLQRVSKYCAGLAKVKEIQVMPLAISRTEKTTER